MTWRPCDVLKQERIRFNTCKFLTPQAKNEQNELVILPSGKMFLALLLTVGRTY